MARHGGRPLENRYLGPSTPPGHEGPIRNLAQGGAVLACATAMAGVSRHDDDLGGIFHDEKRASVAEGRRSLKRALPRRQAGRSCDLLGRRNRRREKSTADFLETAGSMPLHMKVDRIASRGADQRFQ